MEKSQQSRHKEKEKRKRWSSAGQGKPVCEICLMDKYNKQVLLGFFALTLLSNLIVQQVQGLSAYISLCRMISAKTGSDYPTQDYTSHDPHTKLGILSE